MTTEYNWFGGILQYQKTGSEYIYYLYDESGMPYGLLLSNGTQQSYYYYIYNLQGEIIKIVDQSGAVVVEYAYNAWGEILATRGTLASTLGQTNPIRYKGYYYDTETGFYYLNSRYYDPVVRRFVNADSQINNAFLGNNMFAYCENNPVTRMDPNGKSAILTFFVIGIGLGLLGGSLFLPSLEEVNKSAEKHYSRNTLNSTNDYSIDYIQKNYDKQSELADHYYENTTGKQGEDAVYNNKYLSKDGGHIEIIICEPPSKQPYIVDEHIDQLNMGTYNHASNESFFLIYFAEHFVKDMWPYYLYGNTREDDTGWLKWALY